jgi:hypothetical protein
MPARSTARYRVVVIVIIWPRSYNVVAVIDPSSRGANLDARGIVSKGRPWGHRRRQNIGRNCNLIGPMITR